MRPAIISGLSAIGLAIGRWEVPIVFPNVDPQVAQWMLWLAAGLVFIASLLWVWGIKKPDTPTGAGVTQTTSGPSSHAIVNHGTVNIGASAGRARDPDGSEAFRKNELAAKRAHARSEAKIGTRDVSLPEALAYAELGQWGKSFFDAASAAKNEANEQLEPFRQLAHDGALTVWGKRTENGLFQLISEDHWIDHHIAWFDLLRGNARTENIRHTHAEPFSELMVSKAEFEREWPHAQG